MKSEEDARIKIQKLHPEIISLTLKLLYTHSFQQLSSADKFRSPEQKLAASQYHGHQVTAES